MHECECLGIVLVYSALVKLGNINNMYWLLGKSAVNIIIEMLSCIYIKCIK